MAVKSVYFERVEINVCHHHYSHCSPGPLRHRCHRDRSYAERQERRPLRRHLRRRRDLPIQGQGQDAGRQAGKGHQVVRPGFRSADPAAEPDLIYMIYMKRWNFHL